MRNGDEYDCFYWRKVLCVFSIPGVASKTKRRYRRRARRHGKKLARE
jgi:hypothetical protein